MMFPEPERHSHQRWNWEKESGEQRGSFFNSSWPSYSSVSWWLSRRIMIGKTKHNWSDLPARDYRIRLCHHLPCWGGTHLCSLSHLPERSIWETTAYLPKVQVSQWWHPCSSDLTFRFLPFPSCTFKNLNFCFPSEPQVSGTPSLESNKHSN